MNACKIWYTIIEISLQNPIENQAMEPMAAKTL